MSRSLVTNILLVFLSSGIGFIATILVVSALLWLAYPMSNDGPHFSPFLVAIAFFAYPYAMLLFPVQILVSIYERYRRENLGVILLAIALPVGVGISALRYRFFPLDRVEPILLGFLMGSAIFQSFAVFGSYWIANSRRR